MAHLTCRQPVIRSSRTNDKGKLSCEQVSTVPGHPLMPWFSCCQPRDCWDDCTVEMAATTYNNSTQRTLVNYDDSSDNDDDDDDDDNDDDGNGKGRGMGSCSWVPTTSCYFSKGIIPTNRRVLYSGSIQTSQSHWTRKCTVLNSINVCGWVCVYVGGCVVI